MNMGYIVDEKIHTLKGKGYPVLCGLQSYNAELIPLCWGRAATLAVYKDELRPGLVRVVVQLYRPFFLGVGKVTAKGFTVDLSGKLQDLAQEQLYEFT